MGAKVLLILSLYYVFITSRTTSITTLISNTYLRWIRREHCIESLVNFKLLDFMQDRLQQTKHSKLIKAKKRKKSTNYSKLHHENVWVLSLVLLLLSNDINLNPGPDFPFNFSDSFFEDSSNLQNLHTESISSEACDQIHVEYFELPNKGLRLISWNIQSLPNKFDELKFIVSKKSSQIDVLILVESHLNNTIQNNAIQIEGYSIQRKDRINKKGGGLLTYTNNRLLCNGRTDLENVNLEIMWLEIKTCQQSPTILLGQVYRPPSTDATTDNLLLENINCAASEDKPIWIMGDINIDLSSKQNLKHKFYKRLTTLGFKQLISTATRIPSNTCIDHIYTN